MCGEKTTSFLVRGWQSKLLVVPECCWIVLSIRPAPIRAAQNLLHLSTSEISHTFSAFIFLQRTTHQPPGSVDNNCTSNTQIHRLHCQPGMYASIINMHGNKSFDIRIKCIVSMSFYILQDKNTFVTLERYLEILFCFICVL